MYSTLSQSFGHFLLLLEEPTIAGIGPEKVKFMDIYRQLFIVSSQGLSTVQ